MADGDGGPIDLCGLSCAFVLAGIVQAIGDGRDRLEVLCDHPTTVHQTVPLFCETRGYRLESRPEIYPLERQVYRLLISR